MRLQRLIDVADRDALLQRFVAVDVDVDLRHSRAERAVDVLQLRTLARRGQKLLEVFIEERHRVAAAVLQPEREAAGGAEAGNRRRKEREHGGLRDLRFESSIEFCDEARCVSRTCAARLQRLEADEKETVVRGRDIGQQAEASDGAVRPHTFRLAENLLDLAADEIGPLERRCIGQLDIEEEVTLVFIGHETARQLSAEKSCDERKSRENRNRDRRLANEKSRCVDIAAGESFELTIEPREEAAERAVALLAS